jgi:hypothetical protein
MGSVGKVFTRPPNHLNIIMTDAAKFVPFHDMKIYEDFDWSIRLSRHRFFDKEYQSDPYRIHYIYNMGEREVSEEILEWQSTRSIESMVPGMSSTRRPPQGQPERAMRTNGMRFTARGFVSK